MNTMRYLTSFVVLASFSLAILLSGCATTTTEISGVALPQPLCTPGGPPVSIALYWEPQWRPDQKEPPIREALAQRGIEQFLAQHACLAVADLKRLSSGAHPPTDAELLHLAAGAKPPPARVVYVVVRELGPRLLFGLPVLIEGGTEVVIEVRVLDPAASEVLANSQTRWRNGGTFVIKGIKSLDQDMSAALTASLMGAPGSPRE